MNWRQFTPKSFPNLDIMCEGVDGEFFTDTGLTTPAVATNTVLAWRDQSGNGNHLTNPTAGTAPILDSIGGKPALYSSGGKWLANDALAAAGYAGTDQAFTLYIGISQEAPLTAIQNWFSFGATAGTVPQTRLQADTGGGSGNGIQFVKTDAASLSVNVASTLMPTADTPIGICVSHNGTATDLYRDGAVRKVGSAQDVASMAGINTLSIFCVRRSAGKTVVNSAHGRIQYVYLFRGAHTLQQQQRMQMYIHKKFPSFRCSDGAVYVNTETGVSTNSGSFPDEPLPSMAGVLLKKPNRLAVHAPSTNPLIGWNLWDYEGQCTIVRLNPAVQPCFDGADKLSVYSGTGVANVYQSVLANSNSNTDPGGITVMDVDNPLVSAPIHAEIVARWGSKFTFENREPLHLFYRAPITDGATPPVINVAATAATLLAGEFSYGYNGAACTVLMRMLDNSDPATHDIRCRRYFAPINTVKTEMSIWGVRAALGQCTFRVGYNLVTVGGRMYLEDCESCWGGGDSGQGVGGFGIQSVGEYFRARNSISHGHHGDGYNNHYDTTTVDGNGVPTLTGISVCINCAWFRNEDQNWSDHDVGVHSFVYDCLAWYSRDGGFDHVGYQKQVIRGLRVLDCDSQFNGKGGGSWSTPQNLYNTRGTLDAQGIVFIGCEPTAIKVDNHIDQIGWSDISAEPGTLPNQFPTYGSWPVTELVPA